MWWNSWHGFGPWAGNWWMMNRRWRRHGDGWWRHGDGWWW